MVHSLLFSVYGIWDSHLHLLHFLVFVDCSTYLAWCAQSCFLYNICTFSLVLGWDLLPGTFDLLCICSPLGCLICCAFAPLWVVCLVWFSFHGSVFSSLVLILPLCLMLLQARAVSTDGLKPSFYTINFVVYIIQVKILFI